MPCPLTLVTWYNLPLFARFFATSLPIPELAPVIITVLLSSRAAPVYLVPYKYCRRAMKPITAKKVQLRSSIYVFKFNSIKPFTRMCISL